MEKITISTYVISFRTRRLYSLLLSFIKLRIQFWFFFTFQYYCCCYLAGCGGNFSTARGTIRSQNYPNNYPHNTECEWLITVEPAHVVQMNFTDFVVEGGRCNYDYVKVSLQTVIMIICSAYFSIRIWGKLLTVDTHHIPHCLSVFVMFILMDISSSF